MKIFILFLLLSILPQAAFATTVRSTTTTAPSLLDARRPPVCAMPGQPVGGNHPAGECCPGLTRINTSFPGGYTGNCGMPAVVPEYVCSPCGNNICETGAGENLCNCPRDCDPIL